MNLITDPAVFTPVKIFELIIKGVPFKNYVSQADAEQFMNEKTGTPGYETFEIIERFTGPHGKRATQYIITVDKWCWYAYNTLAEAQFTIETKAMVIRKHKLKKSAIFAIVKMDCENVHVMNDPTLDWDSDTFQAWYKDLRNTQLP